MNPAGQTSSDGPARAINHEAARGLYDNLKSMQDAGYYAGLPDYNGFAKKIGDERGLFNLYGQLGQLNDQFSQEVSFDAFKNDIFPLAETESADLPPEQEPAPGALIEDPPAQLDPQGAPVVEQPGLPDFGAMQRKGILMQGQALYEDQQAIRGELEQRPADEIDLGGVAHGLSEQLLVPSTMDPALVESLGEPQAFVNENWDKFFEDGPGLTREGVDMSAPSWEKLYVPKPNQAFEDFVGILKGRGFSDKYIDQFRWDVTLDAQERMHQKFYKEQGAHQDPQSVASYLRNKQVIYDRVADRIGEEIYGVSEQFYESRSNDWNNRVAPISNKYQQELEKRAGALRDSYANQLPEDAPEEVVNEVNASFQQEVAKIEADLNERAKAEVQTERAKWMQELQPELDEAVTQYAIDNFTPKYRYAPDKTLNDLDGLLNSQEFQGATYEEKMLSIRKVGAAMEQNLAKQGCDPGFCDNALMEFYYKAGSKIYEAKDKGTLSPIALKKWAEDTKADLEFLWEAETKAYREETSKAFAGEKGGGVDKGMLEVFAAGAPDLRQAIDHLDEIIKHPLDDVSMFEDFGRGLSSGNEFSMVPFAGSLMGLSSNINLYNISEKQGSGERLMPAEKIALNAWSGHNSYYSQVEMPGWYRAGQITSDAIPFIGEFILTAGVFKAASSGTKIALTKYLTAKFGKELVKKKLVDLSVRGAGVLIGSMAQTGANPHRVIDNTVQRMTDHSALMLSDDGTDLVSMVDKRGENFETAFAKGVGVTWAEFYTERLGWIAGKGLSQGGSFLLSKMIPHTQGAFKRFLLGNFLRMNGIGVDDAAKGLWRMRTGWDGIIGEQFEEIVNEPLGNLITGDRAVLPWDMKEQQAIGLSVLAMQVPFGIAQHSVYRNGNAVNFTTIQNGRIVPGNVELPRDVTARIEAIEIGGYEHAGNLVEYLEGHKTLTEEQKAIAAHLAGDAVRVRQGVEAGEEVGPGKMFSEVSEPTRMKMDVDGVAQHGVVYRNNEGDVEFVSDSGQHDTVFDRGSIADQQVPLSEYGILPVTMEEVARDLNYRVGEFEPGTEGDQAPERVIEEGRENYVMGNISSYEDLGGRVENGSLTPTQVNFRGQTRTIDEVRFDEEGNPRVIYMIDEAGKRAPFGPNDPGFSDLVADIDAVIAESQEEAPVQPEQEVPVEGPTTPVEQDVPVEEGEPVVEDVPVEVDEPAEQEEGEPVMKKVTITHNKKSVEAEVTKLEDGYRVTGPNRQGTGTKTYGKNTGFYKNAVAAYESQEEAPEPKEELVADQSIAGSIRAAYQALEPGGIPTPAFEQLKQARQDGSITEEEFRDILNNEHKAAQVAYVEAKRQAESKKQGEQERLAQEKEAEIGDAPITELEGGEKRYEDPVGNNPSSNATSRVPAYPIRSAKPRRISDIIGSLAKALKVNIRFGGKNAYNTTNALATLTLPNDLDLTGHEVGHFLSDKSELGNFPTADSAAMDMELNALTAWRSDMGGMTPQEVREEGIAEWVRTYVMNPTQAEALAPLFHARFVQTVSATELAGIQAFSTDVRTLYGSSATEQTMSNVGMEPDAGRFSWLGWFKPRSNTASGFYLTFMDRLRRSFTNSLHPFEKAVNYARGIRQDEGDMLPEDNPVMIARLFAGIHEKFDYIFQKGMINSRNQNLVDPVTGENKNIEWLLGAMDNTSEATMKGEMETTSAFMISQRAIEIEGKLQARQIEEDVRNGKLPPQSALDLHPGVEARLDTEIQKLRDKGAKEQNESRYDFSKNQITGAGAGLVPDLVVAEQVLEEMEALRISDPAKHQRITESARRYRELSKDTLKYLLDHGRISQEQYDLILDTNSHYVALQRMRTTSPVMRSDRGTNQDVPGFDSDVFGRSKGGKIGVVKDLNRMKRVSGSAQEIVNPYDSLLEGVYSAVTEADRNSVMQLFTGMLQGDRALGEGQLQELSDVGYQVEASGPGTVTVYRDGQAEHWVFDKDVYRSMKAISDANVSLPGVFTFLPSVMRWSVTNNPVFAVRNFIRDMQHRLVISTEKGTPFDIIGATEHRDDYKLFGAGQAGYYLKSREAYNGVLSDQMKRMAQDKRFILFDPRRWKSDLWENRYQKILRGSEKVPRLAEYKRAYQNKRAELDEMAARGEMNPADVEYNAHLHAAFSARDLMDFAVFGEQMRWINQLVPFSNASIQGLKRTLKSIQTDPGRFALNWSLYVLAPTLLMRAINSRNDDDGEYLRLPPEQRDMFYNVKVGPGVWLSIPKPFELGVMAAGVERLGDQLFNLTSTVDVGDRKEEIPNRPWEGFWGVGGTFWRGMMPVDEQALLGPYKTIAEGMTNYDLFRQRNIVPPYEADKHLRLRHTEHASRMGKALQTAVGIDARKIDHFIEGQFTYFGKQGLRISNIGRDDKQAKMFNFTDFGLFKRSSLYADRDVKWLFENSREYSFDNTPEFETLQQLVNDYYELREEDPEGAERAAEAVRGFASALRESWEAPVEFNGEKKPMIEFWLDYKVQKKEERDAKKKGK